MCPAQGGGLAWTQAAVGEHGHECRVTLAGGWVALVGHVVGPPPGLAAGALCDRRGHRRRQDGADLLDGRGCEWDDLVRVLGARRTHEREGVRGDRLGLCSVAQDRRKEGTRLLDRFRADACGDSLSLPSA